MSKLKVDTISERSGSAGITFSNNINGLTSDGDVTVNTGNLVVAAAGAMFSNNGLIGANTTTTTAANISHAVIGPIDVTSGNTWTIAAGSSITIL